VALRRTGLALLRHQDAGERPVLPVAVGVRRVVDKLSEELGGGGVIQAAEDEAE